MIERGQHQSVRELAFGQQARKFVDGDFDDFDVFSGVEVLLACFPDGPDDERMQLIVLKGGVRIHAAEQSAFRIRKRLISRLFDHLAKRSRLNVRVGGFDHASRKFEAGEKRARAKLADEHDLPVFGDGNDVAPVAGFEDVESVAFLFSGGSGAFAQALDDLNVRKIEEDLFLEAAPRDFGNFIFHRMSSLSYLNREPVRGLALENILREETNMAKKESKNKDSRGSATYKMIELVGTSKNSYEDAINNAISDAAESLQGLEWFQVNEWRGSIRDGKVSEFQAVLKVGFRVLR